MKTLFVKTTLLKIVDSISFVSITTAIGIDSPSRNFAASLLLRGFMLVIQLYTIQSPGLHKTVYHIVFLP